MYFFTFLFNLDGADIEVFTLQRVFFIFRFFYYKIDFIKLHTAKSFFTKFVREYSLKKFQHRYPDTI